MVNFLGPLGSLNTVRWDQERSPIVETITTMQLRGIVINRKAGVPLHRQLESALRDAILAGTLEPGERILSSRELRTHLGLSRNTIVNALSQLHAEGYIETVPGVGAFVAKTAQRRVRETQLRRPPDGDHSPSRAAARFVAAHQFALPLATTAGPFHPGIGAMDLFPARQFRRGFAAAEWTSQTLEYSIPFGNQRLREAIVKRLRQTRGVECTPDQVFVAGGAQAILTLIASVLLTKGDSVVFEDPGYRSVRAIFIAAGARIVAVPVDEAGIAVESFVRRRAKLAYVTPSHQYPTGVVLSLDRRFALLDWAARHDAWIIEDDYDSEFNYTGKPLPPLHTLDNAGRVFYVGTFSKVLAPALRLAYAVIPYALVSVFMAAHQVTGAQPSTLLQAAVATFMERGYFGRHIAKMRRIYDERRRFVSGELEGSAFRVRDAHAGLHFIAILPPKVRDVDFARRAAGHAISIPPLSSYFIARPTLNGVLIGFAATAPPAAKRALTTLKGLL